MNLQKTILYVALFCSSCTGPETTNNRPETPTSTNSEPSWIPPPAGTVIDSFAQKIIEDQLNDFYFKLVITSRPDSRDSAIYDLQLSFGKNINHMKLQLPEWTNGTVLRPEIRDGKGRYHCYVGFFATDTAFHPLYEITVVDKDIVCKQVHAYYLR